MGEGGRGVSLRSPLPPLPGDFFFYFNKSSYHGCAKKREGKKGLFTHDDQ